jgi:hypothetical protein
LPADSTFLRRRLASQNVDQAAFADFSIELFLLGAQFRFGDATGLDVVDEAVELVEAVAERA